jgi:Protein of unknown function (DUF3617)
MIRYGITLLCLLPVLIASAGADNLTIEPGQWKVTSTTVMNGATAQPVVKGRCLTPEQAGDVAKTFGAVSGTVNSTCEPAASETDGRALKWHLQCKGQLNLDVLGSFNFDSPTHYTATVASKAWMGGSLMSDVKTELEGERIGACDAAEKPSPDGGGSH